MKMPEDEKEGNIRERYSNYVDLVALPATDEYGFITDKFRTTPETYSGAKVQWCMLIDSCGADQRALRRAAKKSNLLERGIPLSLKNRIWKSLLGTGRHCASVTSEEFQELKETECKYEYQIHVDVQRTFRHHFLFLNKYGKGQAELFGVLVALANYDSTIGYCQGMSDICAVLLMYFCEKEAFDVYTSLIRRDGLRELFDSSLSKLPRVMKMQNSVFLEAIPALQRHLRAQQIDFSIHGIGWYMTLFSRFNIRLVLRIWDFLFFYGFNVLVYFAAAILKYHEAAIMEARNESLLEIVGRLCDMAIDEDIVVSTAVKFLEQMHYRDICDKKDY